MDDKKSQEREERETFIRKVGEQAERKLNAQRKSVRTIWFGLGTFGLIGWSIVVPTLIGTALGVWIDRKHPGTHSWTLALIVAGLCVGCGNAWHWIMKEEKEIRQDMPKKEEDEYGE